MSDNSTSLENAIFFISEELKRKPDSERSELIDAASKKFDLKPMQAEQLVMKYVME